jgi:hypothetical protein
MLPISATILCLRWVDSGRDAPKHTNTEPRVAVVERVIAGCV